MTKRLKYLVPILLVLVLSLLPIVSAVSCPSNDCWINGTIRRWDTNAVVVGAIVYNSTNASMTYTTNANGYFNISGWDYTNTTASGWHNLSITAPAGYTTGNTIQKIEISGNAIANNTSITRIHPIRPVQSAIVSSSVTKNGATISWTSNNSNVGNIVNYSMDSALGTDVYKSDWSNSTASPSFLLSNLRLNTKWYYQVSSYNIVNNSYAATSTILNFTTLSGSGADDEMGSYVMSVPSGKAASDNPLFKSMIQKPDTKKSNNLIIVILIGVVLYLAFGTGGHKKRR